ncbi:LysM peptidoglycan-binding domain-containing M23 family metallopeptidase [Streptomyces sp. NPDC051211]|uniref:M23 family metallopeptidase n=1 Tax=Streptomyces sp. NPDC051211 TaxID=3154643 RepID=UPI00344D0A6A
MPGKGKHRRPKSSPITRGFVAAGTGGAALALPLLGAAGANAAELPAAHTAAKLPSQVPAAFQAQAQAQAQVRSQAVPAAAPQLAPSVYTVVKGDCLSDIAQDRNLGGGWQQLYADNREAVGSNPSLIHPGLRLTLGGQGAAPSEAAPQAQSEARSEVPSEDSAESEQQQSAPAPQQSAPAPKKRSAQAPSTSGNEPSAASASEDRGQGSAAQEQSGGSEAGASTGAGFVAPVNARINTQYGASGAMWSSGTHTGVDFGATAGTSVKAVGAGTVVSAGWGGSYGNEVVIRHADGHYSQYGHMSQLSVSTGQSVTAGQQVGLVGSTGNSTGPHLHFEIRTGPNYGSDINPLSYLRSKGVSV